MDLQLRIDSCYIEVKSLHRIHTALQRGVDHSALGRPQGRLATQMLPRMFINFTTVHCRLSGVVTGLAEPSAHVSFGMAVNGISV